MARPVPRLEIAVPTLLPGLFAVLAAAVLHPAAIAGLAYVGGTLGTPVASICAAGTFDGSSSRGSLAVVFASLL